MPVVSVNNKCNSHCIMCTNPDDFLKKKGGFSYNFLLKRLERFHEGKDEFLENYRDGFCLTGGEPTLSPYFIRIIKKIDQLFPKTEITCLSNGRRFSEPDYAKRFSQLEANLQLCISIHGHNQGLHDKITQSSGSFKETIKGLKNLLAFRRKNILLEVRVVIHRLNYKSLDKIAEFIKSNFSGIDRVVYIFFEIEGEASKNLSLLSLRYLQLRPYIEKIEGFIDDFPEVRFYHFPLCIIPIKFFPYVWRTLPQFEISFPLQCNYCYLKNLCLGILNSYSSSFDSKEFKPIRDEKLIIQRTNLWHRPIKRAFLIRK